MIIKKLNRKLCPFVFEMKILSEKHITSYYLLLSIGENHCATAMYQKK